MSRVYNFLKRYKKTLFFIACLLSLFLGFYSNFFKISPKDKFDVFEIYSESLVVGRLNMSRQDGIFSNGGLTGWVTDLPKDKDSFYYKHLKATNKSSKTIFYQYEVYNNNIEFDNKSCEFYYSQTGGQAFVFSLIDTFRSKTNRSLELFWIITAILSAVIFSLFLLWIRKTFNTLTAVFVIVFIIFSVWIIWFGKNLWWSLWSFYIPFLSILYFFKHKLASNEPILVKQLFAVSLLSFFIKCFFTGFEYITTTCIMGFMPLIFYWVYQSWNFKKGLKLALSIIIGSISGVFLALCLLVFQISKIKGSVVAGFDYIFSTLSRRTSGNVSGVEDIFKDSIKATTSEVLEKYFNGFAFDFNVFVDTNWKSLLIIDFGELILIFMLFSVVLFYMPKHKDFFITRRLVNALLVTKWLSILAPLSWFIIFKAHSYIHTHMNFIVWYMPFALFGFITIGLVSSYFLKSFYNSKFVSQLKSIWKMWYTIVLVTIVSISAVTLFIMLNSKSENEIVIEQLEQIAPIVDKNNYKIYIHDNYIWYISKSKSRLTNEKNNMFFLHIIPENISDLPKNRQEYTFDNMDFKPEPLEDVPDTNYVLKIKLPEYQYRAINTGQYINGARLWETKYFSPNSKDDN